jgi:phage terminase large subunit-like protein
VSAFDNCVKSTRPARDRTRRSCSPPTWHRPQLHGEWPCHRRGRHFCAPRAQRAVEFIENYCVHTKSSAWARKPFTLSKWQRVEIVEPIFGWVEWSNEFQQWVRVYRIAWLSAGRKNGKTELLAAIALYLLIADGEEGAELVGAAGTRHQAGKVFSVARSMVELSPKLRPQLDTGRLTITQHDGARISDTQSRSYYETISADAEHALGENLHGCLFDEIVTQPDDRLWNALRQSMGTRPQPLLIAATTAGDDPMRFAATEESYCRRVAADPELDGRRYVWIRAALQDATVNDEQAMRAANPALGEFLSLETMRHESAEAMIEPRKALAFRVFHLNTWQRAETRWLPAGRWAQGDKLHAQSFTGRRAHGGVDLAAVSDLTSLCWYFPSTKTERAAALWRHYVPSAALESLRRITGGAFEQWIKAGWVTVTDGDVVDYDALHADIAADVERFAVVDLGIDRWNAMGTVNWAQATLPKLNVSFVGQGFGGQSSALKEIDRQLRAGELDVGADPVAAWCAACAEIRQDAGENIKLVKPIRGRATARVDAIAALANAIDGFLRTPAPKTPGRAAGF